MPWALAPPREHGRRVGGVSVPGMPGAHYWLGPRLQAPPMDLGMRDAGSKQAQTLTGLQKKCCNENKKKGGGRNDFKYLLLLSLAQ